MKSRFVWLGLLLSAILPAHAEETPIQVGQPAPGFALPDQHHQLIHLSDYRGQWVVLYFYPKDDTPGCTTEACSFRDNINHLIAQKAVILGVSVDDTDSHQAFTQKYDLPFPLLSDRQGEVAEQYDSLLNLMVMKFAKRHTFIIDPEGKIAKIYRDVTPDTHVAKVLKDLKYLQHEHDPE